MKFVHHLVSRSLALLSVAFMFCSSQAQAGYVEPMYGHYYGQPYATAGEVKNAVIAALTNGTMKSDIWAWDESIIPDLSVSPLETLNGKAKIYYLPVHPTEKGIRENGIAPGNYKWPGGVLLASCPIGYELRQSNSMSPVQFATCYKPEPCNCDQGGNPIVISSGTKAETAIDYQGAPGLDFTREYRSDSQGWSHEYAIKGFDTGSANSYDVLQNYYSQLSCVSGIDVYFKLPYCFKRLSLGFMNEPGTGPKEFILTRGNGRTYTFGNADNYNPAADVNDRVVQLLDGNGAPAGWSVYRSSDDATEFFDLGGRLLRIVQRNGMQKVFTYSDGGTPVNIAPKPGLLLTVTNHFGQQLNFTYDAQGRMSSLKDPAGGVTSYAYDEVSSVVVSGAPTGNLTSVTYPDNKKRVYWYNEQDKTGGVNLPFALTGITDENGVRFATWTYDAEGHAISSEHAGGVEKNTFTAATRSASPTHTDPFGVVTEHAYYDVLGVQKLWYKVRRAGADTVQIDYSFDANGNTRLTNDFKGAKVYRVYDSRNLVQTQVDAYGSADAQTTTTSWHPTYRIPVQINAPLLKTTYTHDAKGNVLTKTEQATSDTNGSAGASATVVGTPRTWTYTYSDIGQVLTVTGPRTDVVDKTTYTYDNLGNLSTVTNALGHVTTLANYDANGRVGQITDPNGLVTTLSYTPRGWLKQRSTNADGVTETTVYDYDNVGQMTKVTLPDNSTISYTYDDAHRLTKISDSLGNSINYTLDVMGNRTNETVTDAGGTLTRQVSRVYDILNRLQKVTGAAQ